MKHGNSGLSLIRRRLRCTPSFKGSSCICYKWSVTAERAHYSSFSPLILPPLSAALCKAPALGLQNGSPLTLFLLLPLGDMCHLGGMRMEKSLPFLSRILCWLPGARPMPLPEAPAILVLQGQYPAQSQQPLSGKEALVGLRVPATRRWKWWVRFTRTGKSQWGAEAGNDPDKDCGHPLFSEGRQAYNHLSASFWHCCQGLYLCRNHHPFHTVHHSAFSSLTGTNSGPYPIPASHCPSALGLLYAALNY